MTKVGEIAVSTNSYHKFGLDDALSGISEAGFNFVELTSIIDYTEHIVPERMNDNEIDQLKVKLDKFGLEALALSGHSDLTTQEGCDHLEAVIELAGELGAQVVNTGISMEEDPEAELTQEAMRSFYRNIEGLAKFASEKGVNIGLETHGSLKTAQRGIEIINNIESDSVGINYDPGNVILYGGVEPEEDIKKLDPDIMTCMHLKDKIGGKGEWNFPALGEGEIDYKEIFQWLESNGYSGPMSVEIEFDGTEKETLSEVDKAVKDSYGFLTTLLQ